jgi:hypothetical protein
MSRQFLVTKLVCARCGTNLNLTYDVPKGAGQHAIGEPTGAYMVHQLVAVEPCQSCEKPLRDLQRALATLKEVA